MSKRVIAYTRVSTDLQGESGFGLDAQRAQIEAFASAAGLRVMKRFSEIGSAMGDDSILSRPELLDAMNLARKNRWPILVASLDRLSRNAMFVEQIFETPGLKVISAKNGLNADPLTLKSEAVRAEIEGKMISARTKAALRVRKERGVRLGNPINLPVAQAQGAATNKKRALQRAEELHETIRQIRASGIVSAAGIAAALNDRGARTARGLRWTKGNVRRLLERIDDRENATAKSHPEWGRF